MDDETRKIVDDLRQQVDRAREDVDRYSRQPRFNESRDASGETFFTSVWQWVEDMEAREPKYIADSRTRDKWLREFVRKEPHLLGVLNSVAAVDKNRGWSLTGGRNQVIRFTNVFHNWEGAPGMIGWRAGMSSAALSFYTSDLGAVIEVGRDGKAGPLRGMYHVDPARCRLTGNGELPLSYYPSRGKKQDWGYEDFMRVVSLPSTDENYHGLGVCAVSRAAELAKLMIAIYQHDLEQMGAKAPRGLLLLKGIAQNQWEDAMKARDAAQQGDNYKYFDAVAVLASGAADVDAKLVALSQLPLGFDRRQFTDLLLFGYALVFGYDPIEFWPVQFGSLGRGNETQIQHDKATGKGGLDFALGFQEQLQENLPETLQYDLDQRDQEADMVLANIHKSWGEAVSTISQFLTPDEARLILAEREVIPYEWTETPFDVTQANGAEQEALEDEDDQASQDDQEGQPGSRKPKTDDSKSTDTDAERARQTFLRLARRAGVNLGQPDRTWIKQERNRLREKDYIWRAADTFPNEPIVRYEWPTGRMIRLWDRGDDVKQREVFAVPDMTRWSEEERRRRYIDGDWSAFGDKTIIHYGMRERESQPLYDDGDVIITPEEVDRAIDEAGRRVSPDMRDALDTPPNNSPEE